MPDKRVLSGYELNYQVTGAGLNTASWGISGDGKTAFIEMAAAVSIL
ncbi:glycerate kinase [Escherichia sp. E4742]|nr:glycerate kinase [Escherichia sp. E4742]QLN20640.1 hypothetical protein HVZ29_18200 [Escherichia coli]QCT86926.1 glycerate kinase [Escherichia sp. E4742]QML57805.1 hypothetical protein HVX32_18155 [Escherichia coli]TLJ06157.1 glycerate kinase [Escherichia sp. E4742]WFW64135.1 hypothetical protein NFJ77_18680 [Escherichia coli]